MKSPDQAPTSAGPEVIYLRADILGIYVTLRCPLCAMTFERYQPTVAGIPIAEHRCPGCQARLEISPEKIQAAFAVFLPDEAIEVLKEITAEATRVAETWHRSPELSDLLTHRGVDLGAPTERELLHLISEGLVLQRSGRGTRP